MTQGIAVPADGRDVWIGSNQLGTVDDRTALVTLGAEDAVAVIDLVARRIVRRIPVGQSPDGVAVYLGGVR